MLVKNWRSWWRMWSVQAAGLFATVMAAIAANPAPVVQFFNALPAEYKPFVPVLTFVVTFVVPTLLRLMDQPKLKKTPDA